MLLTNRQLAAVVATPLPEGSRRRSCGRVETTVDTIGRRISGSSIGSVLAITVTDISAAGLGLICAEAVPAGEEFAIHLPMLAGDSLVIRAVVRWCRAEGKTFRIGTENLSIMPPDMEFEPKQETFSDLIS